MAAALVGVSGSSMGVNVSEKSRRMPCALAGYHTPFSQGRILATQHYERGKHDHSQMHNENKLHVELANAVCGTLLWKFYHIHMLHSLCSHFFPPPGSPGLVSGGDVMQPRRSGIFPSSQSFWQFLKHSDGLGTPRLLHMCKQKSWQSLAQVSLFVFLTLSINS